MKKLEDIKVGEMYDVRVKVIGITNDGVDALYVDADGGGITGLRIGKQRIGILRLSTPETAPKYDPCLPFRKGDIVEPVTVNGRLPKTLTAGYRYKVLMNEAKNGDFLQVKLAPSLSEGTSVYCEFFADVAYLRLVIPVEELEPYYVKEFIETVQIRRDGCGSFVASYDKESHPHATESAEAERDRLNAEYRKGITQ